MAENTNISGEEIFLWYAFPCAESMALSKRRLLKHFEELQSYVATGKKPRRRLLKHYFRNAYRNLRNFAEKNNLQIWHPETVAKYWRHNHNYEGPCAVQSCIVRTLRGSIVTITLPDETEAVVFNLYGRNLAPGDRVYTHQRMVIEKEEN